ncbi:DUF1254 domain-containing protein [Pseudomonas serbica]
MRTAPTTMALSLALAAVIAPRLSLAQAPDIQVPIPTAVNQVPGPVAGNVMTQSYVEMVGRMAYVWGYPMVNAYNRRKAFSEAPKPGLLGGIIPVAPVGQNAMLTSYVEPQQRFIACPNQDVVYGAGFTALDTEPTVIQVPDFGDRFYVYALYDARTNEVARIGKQYGTKPGFYLIAGDNWKGTVPPGITAVARSSTDLVFVIPRVFKDDTPGDTAAVQPLINQVVMYPLSQFDGKMKTVDYAKLPHFPAPAGSGGETKWVRPASYYEDLADVLKRVPPLPGEEALYAWIRSVWEAAASNPETKKQLVDTFAKADADLVDPLFHFRYNGRPIGRGWTAPANASQWGTDYLNRTAISKSSMYQNTPEETQYQFKEDDSQGQPLDGNHQYTVTFAKGQTPPVKGFWSLTLYNAEHFFHANPLQRFSLGTKNKTLKDNPDGSLTLYLGAKSPGADKESNWLPAPTGPFSLLLRNYWPEASIIDGSWTPPDVVKTN